VNDFKWRRIAANIAKLPELLKSQPIGAKTDATGEAAEPVENPWARQRTRTALGFGPLSGEEQFMPLFTLLPFALVVVIGIVVLYAAYRAGA
jgi:hypothetical protein